MVTNHHPIFSRYDQWTGFVRNGYSANFLGVRTNQRFVMDLQSELVDDQNSAIASGTEMQPPLPAFDEEYFEWIDVLEAVDEAVHQFTMVELGAGYGRWLMNGAAAARQRGLPQFLIGVEAEPTHHRWMSEHLQENGVDRSSIRLYEAAVSDRNGEVMFHIGDPADWYGQAIASGEAARNDRPTLVERARRVLGNPQPAASGRSIAKVRAISLRTILTELSEVDLIDLDVQGSEADVLEAAASELNSKVRRVHIGTHSTGNEARCRSLFSSLGWLKRNDYACGVTNDTPFGRIVFQDGVQTWINQNLSGKRQRTAR